MMSEKITGGSADPDDAEDKPKRSIAKAFAEAFQDIDEQDDEDLSVILGVIKGDAEDKDKAEPGE